MKEPLIFSRYLKKDNTIFQAIIFIKSLLIAIIILIVYTVTSCGSFPNEQLSLDFTGETIPVMLNEISSEPPMKVLGFKSGYSYFSSVISSNSHSGATVSSTKSSTLYINKPLREQLALTFIQGPEWAIVTDLTLLTHRFDTFGLTDLQYLLKLQLMVPIEEKEE